MPVPNSTPIKFSKVREEGNKTSWQSPNYPTPGDRYNINPAWMVGVDENHQIGYNPHDGSFDIAQMMGWDTWKQPVIVNAWIQQFLETSGIRLYWKVQGGDPFRSKFAIFRSHTESDVMNAKSSKMIA